MPGKFECFSIAGNILPVIEIGESPEENPTFLYSKFSHADIDLTLKFDGEVLMDVLGGY